MAFSDSGKEKEIQKLVPKNFKQSHRSEVPWRDWVYFDEILLEGVLILSLVGTIVLSGRNLK